MSSGRNTNWSPETALHSLIHLQASQEVIGSGQSMVLPRLEAMSHKSGVQYRNCFSLLQKSLACQADVNKKKSLNLISHHGKVKPKLTAQTIK
ncbi:hypothetical protein VNO77_17698 [Canavalia gladiata]|uniref:Uncharacterized protein n=1 Tax=Canavalia gladiata TaxID=3824 RepID=A0AAN9LN28_CANGL